MEPAPKVKSFSIGSGTGNAPAACCRLRRPAGCPASRLSPLNVTSFWTLRSASTRSGCGDSFSPRLAPKRREKSGLEGFDGKFTGVFLGHLFAGDFGLAEHFARATSHPAVRSESASRVASLTGFPRVEPFTYAPLPTTRATRSAARVASMVPKRARQRRSRYGKNLSRSQARDSPL
jgi:hypothetical protein